MVKKVKRYTVKEFEALLPRVIGSVTKDAIKIAFRCHVKGESLAAVAASLNVTRQAISNQLHRFERKLSGIKPGWVHFDIWVPPDQAVKIREILSLSAAPEITAPED